MSEPVIVDVAEGIATITLNRPQVRNAIDLPTAEAISDALDELDSRSDVRAGLLTAVGEVFSAGMDLKALNATGKRPITSTRGAFGIAERPPEKPLVAAVEGKAFGGGFELILACDLIVCAEGVQFALPEVRRGMVATAGGAFRLPRRIPRSIAMELLLTGNPIDAARAAELGLVNHVVTPGLAVREARRLAAVIAGNAPLAVRTAKRVLEESAGWPSDEAFSRQAPYAERIRSSADAAEGARAFAEKREPVWTDA
ncbi:crotonase/enoyl-CoA hydratase family protein [Sciscionella marina]|uniref:crotonase/enoyl-CoA hydratase family protein n=1 Tax=Sciscionella marina TaxID=508770 RepID=UPI000374B93D|nr:crotonase/enoyl-CoA hydratase family protein [Sciscionella marina]